MITCRYCSLYCPSITTPIYGHCAAEYPPRYIDLRNLDPYRDCPYAGNEAEIRKISRARGFDGRQLSRLEYYGVSSDGLRTPYYQNVDALREYAAKRGAHYSFYVVFIDAEDKTISRALIT